MKRVPFELYKRTRCCTGVGGLQSLCIRAPICDQTENAMILCSSAGFFKGPGDWDKLSGEELALLKPRNS